MQKIKKEMEGLERSRSFHGLLWESTGIAEDKSHRATAPR